MKKRDYLKISISSIIIAAVGVFVIDYFSHLLFSEPMETLGYFFGKMAAYALFSFLFLSFTDLRKKEFLKAAVGGIMVASLWGMYYNIFPLLYGYSPFGISLAGLTFLGMGVFGTGLAFGIVHTLAFIGGYYTNKLIMKKFKK